ncbi:MAG: cysteine hydrolase [Deltaproteobacteria bacterium]|nr:cysteine hydrolase [Deltaproteobacteria bacterium]
MAFDHKALLIIDMLNDYIEEGSPREVPAGRWIIENIAGEIRYAREKGRPIIYLCDRHSENDLEFEYRPPHAIEGTRGAEVIEALSPQSGDHVVPKCAYSGFYGTGLEELLDELEIDELLICGVTTNICVLYTAMDALQRGLNVTVPETCVAALNEEDHRFALRQINDVLKQIVRE